MQQPLRVLMVIPGSQKDNQSMIFIKRHIDLLEREGLNVERFFLESRTSLSELRQSLCAFIELQSKFKPDIVHCHYGTMTALFCAIAARAHLVITFRGSDLNPTSNDRRFNGRWLRNKAGLILSQLASLRAKRIICVSEQLRSRLWWPTVKSRTSVITTPVNLKSFHIMNKNEARGLLGWLQEDKVVIFNSGKRPKVKRLDLALEAVKVAKTFVNNIKFVDLGGVVPGDQVPILMNAADCLLMTSDYEGSPNVVKEAMACNLPVVSVNVGDVQERLHEVQPSKIVARDSLALGKAMADIFNQNCRSNGRLVAQRDFSQGVINKKTLDVYLLTVARHTN